MSMFIGKEEWSMSIVVSIGGTVLVSLSGCVALITGSVASVFPSLNSVLPVGFYSGSSIYMFSNNFY